MIARQKSSNSTQAVAAKPAESSASAADLSLGDRKSEGGPGKPDSPIFLSITEFEHKVNGLVASKPGFLNILWASRLWTTFLAAGPAAKEDQPFEAVGRQTGPPERLAELF
ncbi:hypothetical protein ACVWYH_002280 [Bradyrhizobium sp. GM24.11]